MAQLQAGSVFNTYSILRSEVYQQSKSRGFILRTALKGPKEAEFRCRVSNECIFKIRAAPVHLNSEEWKITGTCSLEHSCDPNDHIGKSAYVKTGAVAAALKTRFKNEKQFPSGKGIVETAKDEFHVEISRSSAYRVATDVKQAAIGDEDSEYAIMQSYCTEFKIQNPGSIAECLFTNEGRFVRMIVVPEYGKKFVQHCIPCVYGDMARLMMTIPGHVCFASCMDGNHEVMPVGWAIVGPENKEEWKQFLDALKRQYGDLLVQNNFFFMADRSRGSLPAFPEVFPNEDPTLHHLEMHYCSRHVEDNLLARFRFGDNLRSAFKKAVYSYTTNEKADHLATISGISEGALEYLMGIDQHLLFRADATIPKYGILSNHTGECLNSVFKQPRQLSRMHLLKEIENWRRCRQPGHYQATCTNPQVEGPEEESAPSETEEEVDDLEDAPMIDIIMC
jgi:hypothetical protein